MELAWTSLILDLGWHLLNSAVSILKVCTSQAFTLVKLSCFSALLSPCYKRGEAATINITLENSSIATIVKHHCYTHFNIFTTDNKHHHSPSPQSWMNLLSSLALILLVQRTFFFIVLLLCLGLSPHPDTSLAPLLLPLLC